MKNPIWTDPTLEAWLKSLPALERSVISGNTPFEAARDADNLNNLINQLPIEKNYRAVAFLNLRVIKIVRPINYSQ